MNYQLAPNVQLSTSEHGTVILNKDTGMYQRLNRTGTSVLDALLTDEGTEPLAQRLANTTEAPLSVVRADIEELRSALLTTRILIERTPQR